MITEMDASSTDTRGNFNLWETLINGYLKQDDLTSAVMFLNRDIHQLCAEKLYRSIRISQNGYRTVNSEVYGFKHTMMNGYYIKGETQHKKDQCDHILHVKVSKLLTESLELVAKYTDSLLIENNTFFDQENYTILFDLLKAIGERKNKLRKLTLDSKHKIYETVFNELLVYREKFDKLENISVNSSISFQRCVALGRFDTISSLTLSHINEPINIDFELKELRILDSETMFNVNLKGSESIEKITFTLHHDLENDALFKTTEPIKLLDQLQWSKIKQLEIRYNCLMQEFEPCSCIHDRLISHGCLLFLENLVDLTLTQSLRDYNSNELKYEMNQIPVLSNWDDIFISIFLKVPVKALCETLENLCIKQYPSMNGHAKNITDGYYTHRVKKLLQLQAELGTQTTLMSLLLQHPFELFRNLKVLQVPHFLQSLVQIPILSNDLLWNGCQCSVCRPRLEILDHYMHDHLWFRKNISNSGGFGSGVSDKFQELENGEMFAFMLLPINNYCEDLDALLDGNGLDFCWNFHEDIYNGGNMKLIHYEDDHHRNAVCDLSDANYEYLVLNTFKHFLDLYIDYFLFNFPNVKLISLSGFAYRADRDKFGSFLLHD